MATGLLYRCNMQHGIDYLKITLFDADKSEVCDWLGANFVRVYPAFKWDVDVRRSRWESLRSAVEGAVSVAQTCKRDYVLVELKGVACRMLGNDGVKALLDVMPEHSRMQSSRLDYAWDDVGFDDEALTTISLPPCRLGALSATNGSAPRIPPAE